jgi:hypothetical protein
MYSWHQDGQHTVRHSKCLYTRCTLPRSSLTETLRCLATPTYWWLSPAQCQVAIYVISGRSLGSCPALQILVLYLVLRGKFAPGGEVSSSSLCQHLSCCLQLLVCPSITACLRIRISMNSCHVSILSHKVALHFFPFPCLLVDISTNEGEHNTWLGKISHWGAPWSVNKSKVWPRTGHAGPEGE